jgi:mannitol/fructose-specific phosphotransferase system IIA component (Ntr-type)
MVTKEDFLKYYKVQMSGKYNMIMQMSEVLVEAGINYHTYIEIISNYKKYYDKYVGSN